MTLFLPRLLYASMLVHAQACFPYEACGLLGGRSDRVTHLYAVENRLQSVRAFVMEPRQQVEAMLHLAAQGVELLAIYHSHPNEQPRPSSTDAASLTYPDTVQVIISLEESRSLQARAFCLRNGRFSQIPLMLE